MAVKWISYWRTCGSEAGIWKAVRLSDGPAEVQRGRVTDLKAHSKLVSSVQDHDAAGAAKPCFPNSPGVLGKLHVWKQLSIPVIVRVKEGPLLQGTPSPWHCTLYSVYHFWIGKGMHGMKSKRYKKSMGWKVRLSPQPPPPRCNEGHQFLHVCPETACSKLFSYTNGSLSNTGHKLSWRPPYISMERASFGLGWCCSVVWVLACEQSVTSSIPNQSTSLGFRQGPQLGAWQRQLIDVSLTHLVLSPFFLPPFSYLYKQIKIFKKSILCKATRFSSCRVYGGPITYLTPFLLMDMWCCSKHTWENL